MEARAASTRPSIGNVPSNQNVKVDTASSAPIPGPSATPVPPGFLISLLLMYSFMHDDCYCQLRQLKVLLYMSES